MPTLDAIDRKILSYLQSDGRITMAELAEKVGLSVSPCHRRVKLLEERGVITRYIRDQGTIYTLSSSDYDRLKHAGVSGSVIDFMAQTSYPGYPYGPYPYGPYPYGYPYGPYYGPPVVVGVGFGGGYGYHHWH